MSGQEPLSRLKREEEDRCRKAITALEACGPNSLDVSHSVWVKRRGSHAWVEGWVIAKKDPLKTCCTHHLMPSKTYLVDFSGTRSDSGPYANPTQESGVCEWFDAAKGEIKPRGESYLQKHDYDQLVGIVNGVFIRRGYAYM